MSVFLYSPQIVHELPFLSGHLQISGSSLEQQQQLQRTLRAVPHLHLQLPISGYCYQLLSAACPRFEELLQDVLVQDLALQAPQTPAARDAPMTDAGTAPDSGQALELNPAGAGTAAGQHRSTSMTCEHRQLLLYRLDALLTDVLGIDRLAALLSQHAAAYHQDILLLALAEESVGSSIGSMRLPRATDAATDTEATASASGNGSSRISKSPLQQLLLSYQSPVLQSVQHPVLWHMLLHQCRAQLRAFATICSAVAETVTATSGPATQAAVASPAKLAAAATQAVAPADATCEAAAQAALLSSTLPVAGMAGSSGSSSGSGDVLQEMVRSMYQALLPSTDCVAACGGVYAWRNRCIKAVAAADALDHCLAPCSKQLLQNLDILCKLSDLVLAPPGAGSSACRALAAAASQEQQQLLADHLQQLADMLKGGSSAAAHAETLQAAVQAAQQLSDQHASRPLGAFVARLLSASIKAARATIATAAAHSAWAGEVVEIGTPSQSILPAVSSILHVIVRYLFGPFCSSAMLPQLVQLLQLSAYYKQQDGWLQLLQDVQLLGSSVQLNSCPVWTCLHQCLAESGCGADDAPVALLALAVQQCWFGKAFLLHRASQQQAAMDVAAGLVDRAGSLLSKPGLPAVQLAVVVAFLRAVIDAVAPIAVATATTTCAPMQTKSTAKRAGSDTSIGICSNDKPPRPRCALLLAVGKLLATVHDNTCSTRLHSVLLYLLKAMKDASTFAQLQQTCRAIAQDSMHPLQQCMAGLSCAGSGLTTAHTEQLQQRLPIDPYTQLPHYQQVLQVLSEAAAWPASAASLLKPKLLAAFKCSTTAQAWLATLSRQAYLVRGVQSCASSSTEAEAAGTGALGPVVSTVEKLLRDEPSVSPVKQLMLALLRNSWQSSEGSSTGGGGRGGGGAGTLHLRPGASQEQLYICAAVTHLAAAQLSAIQAPQLRLGAAGSSAAAEACNSAAAAGRPGASAAGFAAPLLQYMINPAAAKQQYMLGMPGDEAV